MPTPELFEEFEYGVQKAFGFPPAEGVEGYIACSTGSYAKLFFNAIEGLADKAQEGIIAVLPMEYGFDYEDTMRLARYTDAGIKINGLLTFGAPHHRRDESHFTIIARDLGIAFCQAKKPFNYRWKFKETAWVHEMPLHETHGKLARLALTKGNRSICLQTLEQ